MELIDILKKAEKELVEEVAEERGVEIGEKRIMEIIKRLQRGDDVKKIASDLKTTQAKVKKIKKDIGL